MRCSRPATKMPHIRLSATDISRWGVVDDFVLVVDVDGIMLVQDIRMDWKRSDYDIPGEGATIYVTNSLCRAGTFICTETIREWVEVTTSTDDPTCLWSGENPEPRTVDVIRRQPRFLSSGIKCQFVRRTDQIPEPGNVYGQNTLASSFESD